MTEGFDLSNIGAPAETAVVQLYHPMTDEPLSRSDGKPMTITVYGQDSAVYKRLSHEQQNRRINKSQRSGKATITAEAMEEAVLELLCKTVSEWTIQVNGETPKPTPEAVREILVTYPWVREQLDAAVHDRRNFMRT